jgi:hypothetical protein
MTAIVVARDGFLAIKLQITVDREEDERYGDAWR